MGSYVTRKDPRTGQDRQYYKADDGKLYQNYTTAVDAQKNFAQRFADNAVRSVMGGLNQLGQAVQSGWREADRRSGGWLPGGGTASPLTRAQQQGEKEMAKQIQHSIDKQNASYRSPSGHFSKYGPVVNALGSIIDAGANPIGIALGSPAEIQKVATYYQANPDKTNQYDLNTNLFLRYLSGIGKQDLRLSQEQGRSILGAVQEAQTRLENSANKQLLIQDLNKTWPGSGANIADGKVPVYWGGFSDAPAPPAHSIPWDKDGRGELRNSLGSFWAVPNQSGGVSINNERYDFGYATNDKGGSDAVRRRAEIATSGIPGSMRDIGIRLVTQGYGQPFNYSLDVDQEGNVIVR